MKRFSFLFLLSFVFLSVFLFGQTPNEFYYVNALKASGSSQVTRVLQDAQTGNFFVAGTYTGNLYLDPERPSVVLHATSMYDSLASFIAMYDENGGYLWSMSINPAGGNTAYVSSIDIDHEGRLYAVGYYNSDGLTLSPNISVIASSIPSSSSAEHTGFVMRINPYDENDMGQYFIPINHTELGSRVEPKDCKFTYIGENPTLTICGAYRGTDIDLNLDDMKTNLFSTTGSVSYNGFITSITASSTYQAGNDPVISINTITPGNSISIDRIAIKERFTPSGYDNDTLYFGGTFNGTTSNINTVLGLVSLNAVGGRDIVLGRLKLNLDGTVPDSLKVLNAGSIGSLGNDILGDIKISPNKSKVTVVGSYDGSTFDYNPGIGVSSLTASSGRDGFIALYNPALSPLTAKQVSGASNEFLTSLQIWDDNADTLIVAGHSNSTSGGVTFSSGSITGIAGTDGFVAIVKSVSGDLIEGIRIGGVDVDRVLDVTVSDFGEIIAVGGFQNTVDFDNSSLGTYQETAMGSATNAFISVYGEDLIPFVNSYTSGSNDDEIASISIDNNGNIFAIGTYTSSINIGSTTLNSAGGTDVFIQRKNRNGSNQWAFNAGRVASGGYTISDICAKINSTADDKGRSIVASDTSIYIAYVKNDTAYTQRINKNTGTAQWTQKINKNGSNIAEITADAQDLYAVGDSAGVQMTQRINKNTGTAQWTQKSPGGKGKAIAQDSGFVYSVKDSSGHAVVARINKNTGTAQWTQRIAGNSGSSIATIGNDLYLMSDSSGSIMLRKINKNTGTAQWTQKVGNGTLGNVTVNAGKGAVYIAGTFTGTSAYLGLTSAGGTDGFVARINKNTGTAQWTQRVGGTGADSIKTLQVTAGNDVYIGGNTQGGTFGTGTASAGVFLVRLSVDTLNMITNIAPITAQPDEFACQIYPNPTRDMFNVSGVLSTPQFVQIRMVDLRGQIVYQETYNNQNNIQTTIDVGELPDGIYIVQIQAGKQQVIRKIIKQ